MSDKVNVDDIIGLVKTDEVIDGVEEVRKLRGRAREYLNEFECDDCKWRQATEVMDKNGDESIEWIPVDISAVPVGFLVREWEDLLFELSEKEVELLKLKEFIAVKSFEIEQETDFKELYGKNNADVRKHHIKTELADVYDDVTGLELSINWIKSYIPLLKEVLKYKRQVKIFGE